MTARASATTANGVPSNDDNDRRSISFIVTGFGPFGCVEENPTTIITNDLTAYLSESSQTWKKQLASNIRQCVVMETSAQAVRQTLDSFDLSFLPNNSTILLHLGVNYKGTGFQLEQCAYNDASFRIPDQQFFQPQKESIISMDDSSPFEIGHCCHTTLNVAALCQAQQQQQDGLQLPEIKISTDPGRFVCNYAYYYSLQRLARENKQVHSLFVHVPPFSVVPKEAQFHYVADLMQRLIQQVTETCSAEERVQEQGN
jgi:pyroglutamyl-peptidase